MASTSELEKIRKAQIIEACVRTIAKSGFSNVKMDDIVRESGLSKGGIAHYFKSKDELFKSAFREYSEHIFKVSSELMSAKENPMEKLTGGEVIFDRTRPEVDIAYPMMFDFMAMAVHDEDYKEYYQEWTHRWANLLSEPIEEGIRRGIFKPMDSLRMGQAIFAVYHGLALQWFLGREALTSEWAINACRNAIYGLMTPYLLDA